MTWKPKNPRDPSPLVTPSCAHDGDEFKITAEHSVWCAGFRSKNISLKGYDWVILFDSHSGKDFLYRAKPWKKPRVFAFPIPDGSVPDSLEEFNKLLNWMRIEINDGKKILMGCIGSHGRTGLVLSALVKSITGDPKSSHRVRAEHCHKAIETTSQVKFLETHYGIERVAPSRKEFLSSPKYQSGWDRIGGDSYSSYQPPRKSVKSMTEYKRGKSLIFND